MSAVAIPLSELASSRRWQSNFMTILPAVEKHASVRFHRLPAEAREEATAEAVAAACVSYARLARQKKLAQVYPGSIATFAVKGVHAGRHVGGHLGGRDLLNPLTQKKKGIVVGTLSSWDSKRATWKDIAVESRRTSPADTAAFRLDFQTWLKTWNRRHRKIIAMLGAGYRTLTVARKLGVSAARVSQFRRQYRQSWEQFQNTEPAVQAA